MKPEIHPTYHPKSKVTCSCGASFTVGSTLPHIEVEVCSECHPFYTGKGKLIDTAGRVDRYRARTEAKAKLSRGGKQARKTKNIRRREKRAKRIEQ